VEPGDDWVYYHIDAGEGAGEGGDVMGGDQAFMSYAMELLAPLGDVRSRSMFGGYGIFHEGDMFALISGSTLYFKVDDTNRAAFEAARSHRFQTMPYFSVSAEVLEGGEQLHDWAGAAIAVGHATATKKRRKPRGG
jgi:DNA transformation protein